MPIMLDNLGKFSLTTSQVTGSSLQLVIPGGTVVVGGVLHIEALITLTPANFSATKLVFTGTTTGVTDSIQTPAWNGSTANGVIIKARLHRIDTVNWSCLADAEHIIGPTAAAPTFHSHRVGPILDNLDTDMTIDCQLVSGLLDVISLKAWIV